MNRTVKIALYVVLLAAATALGLKFFSLYRAVMAQAPDRRISEEVEVVGTNSPAVTALPAGTNVASRTNVPPPTNVALATNLASGRLLVASNVPGGGAPAPPTPESPGFSTMMSYGVALFVVVVCLAVLLAHDVSHFVAERFYQFILSDDGSAMKDPTYERAEELWKDGKYLEAIQLMREHLKRNPREQYVALRIAEIYEQNLGNPLAAALEYEEILKHRLLPEQWGWAAIHLANLYSGKLDQTDKAIALLRRIVDTYGETAAAAKARKRLEQIEGGKAQASVPLEEEPGPPPPPSNLPRGFRPRK